MRPTRYTLITILFFLTLCQISSFSFGQTGISFNLKKPKEYDDRVLRSEKSEDKKFTLPKRLVQNTITHYNYFFNANNKLNEVIEKAKTVFVDDYSVLLPFYNYTLEATAKDSIQLDSITYKSSTGIALHDLRNDWADNLYLLWGAAYYLKKDFDSAYLMFQFINYAFAPKEKDGYYLTIGSNRDGNKANSIATKERTSLTKKIFSEPPSRNDAFIWQIRNFLAQDQFPEAASLIVTLRNDINFPKRLQSDLHEVQAYSFYKQNLWDSAAVHLSQALDNATNKQEKARWEYLLAQLYELTGDYKLSQKYYDKVSSHTTDAVMDIYARLYSIRVNKEGGDKYIEKNIAELIKMAKRDKYQEYRDIIYYTAAQMELERNNVDAAQALLLKSIKYPSLNPAQRNKAFLQLAGLAFAKKQYRQAYNFYDSLRMDDPSLKDVEAINKRKKTLGEIATDIETIQRQDSLQRITLLPEDQRKDLIKKMVKQLRKEQGLKDEASATSPVSSGFPGSATTAPTNLFQTGDAKGEWYFYNAASRSRGANDFKNKWGNRKNTDNWRRSAAVANSSVTTVSNTSNVKDGGKGTINNMNSNSTNASASGEITYDGLYANLPFTPDQIKKSNDSIQSAMFDLGKLYIQDIEDCTAGTETLELLRIRFPNTAKMDEILFNLYYCYNKNGDAVKAAAIKKLMGEKYTTSNFTAIVTTGKNPQSAKGNTEATKTYEKIYDLFIEGSFEEAIAQKKIADSLYGKNFWTPQLLYIESVYYIKQREDSTAKVVLNTIISGFAGTPLAAKATNLLKVLNRRKEIEEELNKLSVTRAVQDTSTLRPVNKNNFIFIKPGAADTTNKKATQPVVVNNTAKPVTDSLNKTVVPKNVNTAYIFKAEEGQYVMIVLNKIDPVFGNEAKNAFFRYNRESFSNKLMTADLVELDADNRLLLIGSFKNVAEAVDYVDKTRPKTATDIIPWLKGGKYSFSIITEKNLDLLKASKDVEGYKKFVEQNVPGKF